jgi:hypothetical protein
MNDAVGVVGREVVSCLRVDHKTCMHQYFMDALYFGGADRFRHCPSNCCAVYDCAEVACVSCDNILTFKTFVRTYKKKFLRANQIGLLFFIVIDYILPMMLVKS